MLSATFLRYQHMAVLRVRSSPFRPATLAQLADGSHFVPFATGAIRSFVPLFTHCTLRPSARSRLFFHAQNPINSRLLLKKEIKRNPLIDKNQKKRSKDKSSYRSVKAKPFGFGQKSPPSHTRVVFLPKALTALPSFLDAVAFFFSVFF